MFTKPRITRVAVIYTFQDNLKLEIYLISCPSHKSLLWNIMDCVGFVRRPT